MSDQSFTTSKATLNVQANFISIGQFIGNLIVLDAGLIVVGVFLWYIFWYSINKLTIWDIKYNEDILIGRDSKIFKCLKALQRILKNMSSINNNYIINQCGFEAFAYLFFLRRFSHLMCILAITDLCIFVPYQIYFNDASTFSLASIDSDKNQIFRTFYTLWITIAVLYSITEMKKYLRLMLKNQLLRCQSRQDRLVNNLKTKTVLIHFAGENRRIDSLQVKTRLVQQLKIYDTILACVEVPNNSKKIEIQYQYLIYCIVKQIEINNFHSVWRFFKEVKEDPDQKMRLRIEQAYSQAENDRSPLNSYLIVFQSFETAQALVKQFCDTRSIFDLLSENKNNTSMSDVQNFYNDKQTQNISVNWAQEPYDIRWICIGASEKSKILKYIWMNILSVLLIFLGVAFMILSRSRTIINVPKIILPIMLSIINVTLRFFLSKSSEWQTKHFQYEWHMKEMKVLLIFFIINVLGGSLVRDTLNLVDILTTGWGWLQLIGLIYKKPDGFFYYGFIVNEVALTLFALLFKLGDLFIEVFHSNFTYQKNTLVRHKSRYGTNDPFRYGYFYAQNILVFAIIFMYSASCPLIHFFGFVYFFCCYYMSGYTITVFHKYGETCSNMRLLETVCEYIQIIMISIIFLIGITMMFQSQYSCVLILYFWQVVMLWLMFKQNNSSNFLKDFYTDEELRSQNLTPIVNKWRAQYEKSMRPIQVKI